MINEELSDLIFAIERQATEFRWRMRYQPDSVVIVEVPVGTYIKIPTEIKAMLSERRNIFITSRAELE